MENEDTITLGGNRNQEQPKINNHQQATSVNPNISLPKEYIDTEFQVPTDEIELPSEGIFYPNKQKTVTVKYLTAEEENILTTPELIQNGRVLDVLLEQAIIDKNLRPDNMISGDRNKVLLSLRASGYGDDYTFKTKCPQCKADYKQTIKISTLSDRKLDIMPDLNGEFEIDLPKMRLNLKFRLLNGKDEVYLNKKAEQSKKAKNNVQFSNQLTERLLLQIMEVNGNRDKIFIKKVISNMPISDSLFLRSYISENEPGVNMEKEFECTECGHTFEDTVPITATLFWPNAKI